MEMTLKGEIIVKLSLNWLSKWCDGIREFEKKSDKIYSFSRNEFFRKILIVLASFLMLSRICWFFQPFINFNSGRCFAYFPKNKDLFNFFSLPGENDALSHWQIFSLFLAVSLFQLIVFGKITDAEVFSLQKNL
jgi:hypothetical protein